jgi:cell division protein FtsW
MSTYTRSTFARTDRSIIAQWWWTVDRWTIVAILALIAFGSLMVMAASPAVAVRIGADNLHFIKRYFLVLPIALALMFMISLMSPRAIRLLAFFGLAVGIVLLAYTLMNGVEIKGARRWINLPGESIQPSEFVKPCFAVVSAWLFAQAKLRPGFPGNWIATGLYVLIVGLLIKQPDLGMTAVVSVVWFTQFFLAGLSQIWVVALMGAGVAGLAAITISEPKPISAMIARMVQRSTVHHHCAIMLRSVRANVLRA